jgi:hypothetical protein
MCGGDIEITENTSVGCCKYCGSTMTLPKIDEDKKARLFNRANEYRLNNEFDKAYDAYQSIVEEDDEEAEGYWGMVLSEYGIEYVEDPKTGKRVPTCHRTHTKSIRESVNYQMACKYADTESALLYRDEAEIIDSISRKIAGMASKVEPYDVFICYKETDDETKERTADSVLAQEIYDELTNKGIKVFFSRISLEDKLGQDYEPYIYSALTSARVMLVVTTSMEHCNAVWVKNEWSRFLAFMNDDAEKVIIPVYKNMSAYELPDELSKYQAQDMEKVGAIQDLVRNVQKLLGKVKSSGDVAVKELREEIEKKNKRNARIMAGVVIVAVVALVFFSVVKKVKQRNSGTSDNTSDELSYYYDEMESVCGEMDYYYERDELGNMLGYYDELCRYEYLLEGEIPEDFYEDYSTYYDYAVDGVREKCKKGDQIAVAYYIEFSGNSTYGYDMDSEDNVYRLDYMKKIFENESIQKMATRIKEKAADYGYENAVSILEEWGY